MSDNEWDNLYSHRKWRRIRARQLAHKPLCEWCERQAIIKAADTVHHVTPHKGDRYLFFHSPLVSLCKLCHDSIAHSIEMRGYDKTIGADGWPVDPQHPANR